MGYIFLISSLLIIIIFLGFDYLNWKAGLYIKSKPNFNYIYFYPLILLIGFSAYYSKQTFNVLMCFLPILIGIFLFGTSRMNMMGYFVFLYYALKANGGLNTGVLLTSFYLSYKTLNFVMKIVSYGDGFY